MSLISLAIILNTSTSIHDGRLQHKYPYFVLNMQCICSGVYFMQPWSLFTEAFRYWNDALSHSNLSCSTDILFAWEMRGNYIVFWKWLILWISRLKLLLRVNVSHTVCIVVFHHVMNSFRDLFSFVVNILMHELICLYFILLTISLHKDN